MSILRLIRASLCALLVIASVEAASPIYVAMFFDTEDFVDPASDDAALRIATDLTNLGAKATFKVVGEKARVLAARGRKDVIQALARHSVGYHSNFHSVHPTPAEYLRPLGFMEGAEEFERREAPGARDVQRIFGVAPSCYGQPGSSWGPQSNLGLRRIGIPVYFDEGEQVGIDGQPFWYGGLLYIYNMRDNFFRASLAGGPSDPAAHARFDEISARLKKQGGGVVSIYYHPTEFVNLEFWDAVNFSGGANPPREQWKRPRARTKEDAERCYRVLTAVVKHMKKDPDVRFVTPADLLHLTRPVLPRTIDPKLIAKQLTEGITFLESGTDVLSPADMLVQLAGLPPQLVDGPTTRIEGTWSADRIPRPAFEIAAKDAANFIQRNHRLPAQVFVGAETLSLPDFAATLAASILETGDTVPFTRGKLVFERYFSTDAVKSFNWVIHKPGFAPVELLELARLQGWTLKPARLTSVAR